MAALDDLAGATGLDASSLAFLEDDDEHDVAALAEAVRVARARRDAELRAAIERAFGVVPRPLRARIRKLLGGGGRG